MAFPLLLYFFRIRAMPTPARPRPSPAPPAADPAVPFAAISSCQACPVRHYCALYAPHQANIPVDCPFGPGPDTAPRGA